MRALSVLLFVAFAIYYCEGVAKTVCYYNHKAFKRDGTAKVGPEELKPALSMCTHLVYGFAGISDSGDYHIKSLDKELDTDKNKGKELFKQITALKTFQPNLNIMLSVGGFEDDDDKEKYLEVLDDPKYRKSFIETTVAALKKYGFNGLDLAWEFPVVTEKHESYTLGSIWHKIKKTVTGPKDDNPTLHREHFTLLIREMKAAFRAENFLLSASVLPHVNYTVYFDVPSITQHLDMITLHAYDFRTPQRNPKEADYSAPLHFVYGRVPHQNANAMVRWFIEHGVELQKLVLGIPTFGRSWLLEESSHKSGIPPLVADGAGEKGTITKEEGLLSYAEICPQLVSITNAQASPSLLRKQEDPQRRLGTYAFRLADKKLKQEYGTWVSFEEPETAGYKASYAKLAGLGGVAIIDLSLDDFRGMCNSNKFPILRAARTQFV
ncbi:chitinase-like protein EN03 [Diaphorina citri]|uniref:Chitinase-like protein EN03 n=1 Tax=Diaphorina citri TaxID=121845 RepID=A0A3Q0JKF3_DIACI|nr:chitinase-like protein EN03 [Diaphorina citri]